MNAAVNPPAPARLLALPNLLTYGRIAAVPVVVALMYWQSILQGGLWLRWVALAFFITAGITDVLDGYFARTWDQQSLLGRMLDPIADKLLVSFVPADAGRRGNHSRLVIARRRRHPVPRNPGLRPARVPGGVARERAGHQARQMEDDMATRRRRLPNRGQSRRQSVSFLISAETTAVTKVGLTLLWLSALVTLYTGWDYLRAGLRHLIEEDS